MFVFTKKQEAVILGPPRYQNFTGRRIGENHFANESSLVLADIPNFQFPFATFVESDRHVALSYIDVDFAADKVK